MAGKRGEDPRLTNFKKYVAGHREIESAKKQLLNAILHSAYDIVFLVGATGVGKTTLLGKVASALVEVANPNAPENRNLIPVVTVEAKAPVGAGFPWSVLFADALEGMGDPHVGAISLRSVRPETQGSSQFLRRVGSESERYRDAYVQALKNRRPFAVMVDEGHSMAGVSAQKLPNTMEVLKSLTNVTGVMHVLAGTYAMQPLMWHSGQLARRTKIIHFPPYDADNPDDVDEFGSVVEFFESRLPIPAKPKLEEMTERFFAQSGGLIGVLSTWLYEALSSALTERARSLTERHLRDAAPTPGSVKAIRSEADEGRRFLEALTGGTWSPKVVTATKSAPAATRPKKGRPGKRKPTRDKVGRDDQHDE